MVGGNHKQAVKQNATKVVKERDRAMIEKFFVVTGFIGWIIAAITVIGRARLEKRLQRLLTGEPKPVVSAVIPSNDDIRSLYWLAASFVVLFIGVSLIAILTL